MLFPGLRSVRTVKNCDLGLENAALGLRPRAAFSRPRSQFFTIRTDRKSANNIYVFPIHACFQDVCIISHVLNKQETGYQYLISIDFKNLTMAPKRSSKS